MKINLIGISTSPRKNGNSDLLLKKALSGAESMQANIEYINLNDYNINPCIECNRCYATGQCVVKDDYNQILEKLLNANRLIFATPIFFMNVCAQAKMLIDRGQCLWAKKYIIGKSEKSPHLHSNITDNQIKDCRAMVIAVGGSKSRKQFESIRWTFKAYFDSLEVKYISGLFVDRVDNLGDIEKHPSALEQAYKLGAMLADPDIPLPENPIEIEIISD